MPHIWKPHILRAAAAAAAAQAAAAQAAEEAKELEEAESRMRLMEEEPDFPGDEEVMGWSHEALEQWDDVDFYIDEENNIWDECREFVGIYNGCNDTIEWRELGYEPEE